MNQHVQYQLFRYLHEREKMLPMERFAVSVGLVFSASRRSEYQQMASLHRDLSTYFAGRGSGITRTPWQHATIVAGFAVMLLLSGILFTAKQMQASAARIEAAFAAPVCRLCHRPLQQCPHCATKPPTPITHVCP